MSDEQPEEADWRAVIIELQRRQIEETADLLALEQMADEIEQLLATVDLGATPDPLVSVMFAVLRAQAHWNRGTSERFVPMTEMFTQLLRIACTSLERVEALTAEVARLRDDD